MSIFWVISPVECSIKRFEKFFTDCPAKTREGLEEGLLEQGVDKPCVVEIKEGNNVFFVQFNTEESFSEDSEPVQESVVASTSYTPEKKKQSAEAHVGLTLLAVRICYMAFPLMKDELEKMGWKLETVDGKEKKDNFEKMKAEYEQELKKVCDLDKLKNMEDGANECFKDIFKFVKAIVCNRIIPTFGESCSTCSVRIRLETELIEKNKIIAAQAETIKEQAERIKELEEEIEKLKNKKPHPPLRDDATLKGKEIEFKPEKFTYEDPAAKKKEERVVFKHHPSTYKFFLIHNDLIQNLDPTKPAKMKIETFEQHCSTDQPEDMKLAREYNMPKGEDYYICRGTISQ